MDIKELELAMFQARSAKNKLEGARSRFVREKREAAQAAIESEAREIYSADIATAHETEVAATKAYEAEKVRIAQSGDGAPFPIGTRLCRWDPTGPRYARHLGGYKIAATGVVEVVTPESEHPGNIGSYSRASPGEFVIRLLKKDGSTGAKYEKFSTWMTNWLPEGQKHPQAAS